MGPKACIIGCDKACLIGQMVYWIVVPQLKSLVSPRDSLAKEKLPLEP